MKILVLEQGYHGFMPMKNLLDEGMITKVQFLLHSAPVVEKEYKRYCRSFQKDPYDESVATDYLSLWDKKAITETNN